MITNLEVYYSSPSEFEDKKDCQQEVRYDLLSDSQMAHKYLIESLSVNKTFTLDEHFKFTFNCLNNWIIYKKENLKELQNEYKIKFSKSIGINSLTANPVNNFMWNKYSDYHKGFCVGFNSEYLLPEIGGGGIVDYSDNLPNILPYPYHSIDEQNKMMILNKIEKYRDEDEYRTFLFKKVGLTENERKIILPKLAYKEIIFGAEMTESDKTYIIKSAIDKIPHIKFKQSRITDGQIILDDFSPLQ